MFSGALHQSSNVFQSELGFYTRSSDLLSDTENDLYATAQEWYQLLEQFQAAARQRIKELRELRQQFEWLDEQINVARQKTCSLLKLLSKPVEQGGSHYEQSDESEGVMDDRELIFKLQIERQYEALETYMRGDAPDAERQAEAFLDRLRTAWLNDHFSSEMTDEEAQQARVDKFLADMRSNWRKLCAEADFSANEPDEAARAERLLKNMQLAWKS